MPVADNAPNRAFTEEIIPLTITIGSDAAAIRDPKSQIPNRQAFPRSANAYDNLGEAYLESGDKNSVIENYKKSLEPDPENENANEVLKSMEAN